MKKAKIIMVIGTAAMLVAITILLSIALGAISKANKLSEELDHTKMVLEDVQDDCEFVLHVAKSGYETGKIIGWEKWAIQHLEEVVEKK